MIALMLTVELLSFAPQSARTDDLFRALQQAASRSDVTVRQTAAYRGGADVLMLWGPGAPNRWPAMQQQIAAGGHVLAWDLAYWDRDRKVRVSIDAAHPQRWVMRRDFPAARLESDRVTVQDRWNPAGPVILAGLGRKARIQYGETAVAAWEAEMMAAAAHRGRQVLYRRKQADAPVPGGARLASDGPIDQVLAGASLLITWHSNVAVDAIRLGVPVICRDGAAAAVCPSTFQQDDPAPLAPAVSDRFLRNLAWFQWAPTEAKACWAWVREVLA